MSDVSLGLSGGWPQQLDSLISNSTWMGDTGRQGDFLFMHSERRKPWIFYLWIHVGAPFKTLQHRRGEHRLRRGRFTPTLLRPSLMSPVIGLKFCLAQNLILSGTCSYVRIYSIKANASSAVIDVIHVNRHY